MVLFLEFFNLLNLKSFREALLNGWKVAISMLFFSIIIAAFSYHTVASRVNLVLSDVNQLSEK